VTISSRSPTSWRTNENDNDANSYRIPACNSGSWPQGSSTRDQAAGGAWHRTILVGRVEATQIALDEERLNRDGRDLARALYGIYVKCDYDVPGTLRDIGWFDDAFDLAAQGAFGSVEDVQQQLVEFTKQFAN
jgi:hypothetical protein